MASCAQMKKGEIYACPGCGVELQVVKKCADEVKCAHGATTGRLDPDMLFYMLSRGIDRDTAQSLLVFAFLADVLTGMSVVAARAAIENALIAQLPDSQTLRKFR